ncbi:hypothetical protein HPB49_014561 [Dermacentor silvarum]|uniref:Uncharacterized protein n=1 Tax=Dermacentor silvarum TaxID=543639 RepID=A0ACB8DIM8_DERSI|nr:hypothetical protein HPB49_014561 [Dermacentor silvarum]
MHYLPRLRKFATKKNKQKPQRARPSQPLDFHTERSKSATASGAVPQDMPSRPVGQRLRHQLIGERVAAAVPLTKELRHWAEGFPWRRTMHAAIAVAVIVGVCVAALMMAHTSEAAQPICDDDCMVYTKLFNQTMDWSVDPCQDFYRFVCGRLKNKSSVRRQINDNFFQAVADIAKRESRSPGSETLATAMGSCAEDEQSKMRRQDVPAEGQTAAQKAARLFKTCNDIVTQDTDYVPRIRGYLRDANLHWPQHPETRDLESVDVFRSILEINEKWGWPCLLELRTDRISETRFEHSFKSIINVQVATRPSGGIDDSQRHAFSLGLGSPAHRTYFQTLYAHYGGGVLDGVTFEEMLNYEYEIMQPLLVAYYAPPRRYVFERNNSDTSGTWERWTSVIKEFYHLSGNEHIEISTTHQDYFKVLVELITTKETIVELVLGWMAVQYTSQFANRPLIANYHNILEQAEEHHMRICFSFTGFLMGTALFLPFLERVYTEPVRIDVRRIAKDMRRTVYQKLELGTYPWDELDVVFKYMEIARVDDIEARFSKYPDMETSFMKNLRDAIKAKRQTDSDDIGGMPPPWLRMKDLYHARITHDRFDHALKPSILVPPMYHLTAPQPVRLGTFGVEVAKATIESYLELRNQGHRTDVLDGLQFCFFGIKDKERKEELSPEWIRLVETNFMDSAALDVGLSVLKLVPSFDEDRLHDVPLTGHQLFYVAHCYTHCGDENGTSLCNEPLKHKEDFANAFSCPTRSHMRSEHKCPSF